MADDRLTVLHRRAISPTSFAAVVFLYLAISCSASQNSFSSETLVFFPLMRIERLAFDDGGLHNELLQRCIVAWAVLLLAGVLNALRKVKHTQNAWLFSVALVFEPSSRGKYGGSTRHTQSLIISLCELAGWHRTSD